MKTMGHKIQTRVISGLLVFVMVFASIVSAGLAINGDLNDLLEALGFDTGKSSSANLEINTASPNYDFATDAGNWGYEIVKTTGLVLDGLKEDAYTKSGVTLPAAYALPTSGSTFDVSFAADGKYIYVLYEFTKKEAIFYPDATDTNGLGNLHWFDCVDFVLGLDAKEVAGKEFRIQANIEGDKTAATFHGDASSIGVDNWYVKHTDKGYNVEFTIPLSKVTGQVDGNKAVSFTALSTITTSYTAPNAPARQYTAAVAAAGALNKAKPSTLVVKDAQDVTLGDGRYKFFLTQSNEAINGADGLKDAAYANGLYFPSAYTTNSTVKVNDQKNRFDLYLAADAQYVYALYEVKDTEIFTGSAQYYHNDCVELLWNLTGAPGYKADVRIYGEAEGTLHYETAHDAGNSTYKAPYGSNNSLDAINAIKTAKSSYGLKSYTVKHTEDGYNVEFIIERAKMAGKNTFAFLGCATHSTSNAARTYAYTTSSFEGADNPAKQVCNVVEIVTSDFKANDNMEYATPDYTLDAGTRYGYYLVEADGEFVVDGIKDEIYKSGLKFKNEHQRAMLGFAATPDPKNTYDLYIGADEYRVAVLWEFTDNNIVTTGKYNYYNDAAQFVFGKDGRANAGGGSTIDYGTGPRAGYVTYDGATIPYMVVKTEKGFNVEVSFPRSVMLNSNTFSFLGLSTIASDADHRTYGHMTNAIASAENEVKEYLSFFHILDDTPKADSKYNELIDDNTRWKFYLEETDKVLVNDGYKDPAYLSGLKFSNAYNRVQNIYTKYPVANNNYDLYVAADKNNVSFLFEVVDNYIVTSSPAGEWRDDNVQFAFDKDGLAGKTFDKNFLVKGGQRTGSMTAGGITLTYTVVYTDKGYNVEITAPRSAINGGNLFSFMGRVSLAHDTDKNTYGFIDNPVGDASDVPLTLLHQVEIVDMIPAVETGKNDEIYTNISAPVAGNTTNASAANTPTKSETGYDVYTAYKSDIVLDGYKDATYVNAAHFFGDLADSKDYNGKTGFDAYVAYGSDGLIYIYVDVYDDFVAVPDELWDKTNWHTDSFDIYTWHGDPATNRGTYHVSAPENGVYNRNPSSAKKQPINVEKRLTSNGWAFEMTIKYNDAAELEGGETIGIQFFYNNLWRYTDIYNYGKYTVTNPNQNYPAVYMDPNSVDNEYESMNRVTFNAGAAPVNNKTSIFDDLKGTANIAVVYPKEASAAVLATANAVVKSSGGILYEEGTASIEGYAYKIYVGHVMSAPETKAMIDTIGYARYGVGVFGNNISIIAPTEQTLNKAAEVFAAELNGTLAANTLYSGTSVAVAGYGLAYLENTRIVSDNGYGNYMLIKNDVTVDDFNAYCNGLTAAGYKLYATNVMGGKFLSKTFYNATEIVTVDFGLNYSKHFIIDGNYNFTTEDLNATENALKINVASRAIYDLPALKVEDYEPVTDTAFVLMGEGSDSDLCEIIRLDNGEFLIFDSEHNDDADDIMGELYALTGGKKPVVAAWFLTHFHQDHVGGLRTITNLKNIQDKIEIKEVVLNLGSEQIYSTAWTTDDTPSTGDKANMDNLLAGFANCGTRMTFAFAGQTFNYANATVEVLLTFSDSMPMNITVDSTNRTNSLFTVTLRADQNNTADKVVLQKFMITGDMSAEQFNLANLRYGAYLKSDVLQLPHHGYGEYAYLGSAVGTVGYECNKAFYASVNPTHLLVAHSGGMTIDKLPPAEKELATAVTEAGGEFINNKGKPARLAIPYAKGVTLAFPNAGTVLTPPKYTNTATGVKDSANNVAVNAEDKITMPYGMTEGGSYYYVANTAYTNITVDGVMDNIYTYGIHLEGNRNTAYDVSYDVYLIAGQDGYIHVFYDVKDSTRHNYTTDVWDTKSNYAYRQDGVDFWFGFLGDGYLGTDVRIVGKNSAGDTRYTSQAAYYAGNKNTVFGAGKAIDNFAVVENADGYTVEFVLSKNGEKFANGDEISFAACVNSIYEWTDNVTMKNLTTCPDTAVTSETNAYYAPNNVAQQWRNNVLVFSSADATALDETKKTDADNDAVVNTEELTFPSEIIGVNQNGIGAAQKVYGINTVYADIVSDGVKDAVYSYGYKVSGEYVDVVSNAEKHPHSFDAYLVYGQDGKIHVFVEATDPAIFLNARDYWRRDSIHFYYSLSNGDKMNSSYVFEASETNQPAGSRPEDYKVTLTDKGYNVEFSFDRNGVPFRPGDIFEFGIYMNCAGAEYTVAATETADAYIQTEKHSLTHSSYWMDEITYYTSATSNYGSPDVKLYDGIKILSTDSAVSTVKPDCEHSYDAVVKEPTCTEGGYTTYTCSKCGISYVDDETDALDHDYKADVTAPTCTEGGFTTHTCANCGDTYVDSYTDPAGHKYGNDNVCDVCGVECTHSYGGDHVCDECGMAQPLKVNSAALSLGDNIAINFKVRANQFISGYSFVKFVFEFNGSTYEITDLGTVDSQGYYIFVFDYAGPHQMADTVYATLYTEYDGKLLKSTTVEYSVQKYCDNQLSKAANPAALKKVLVDILNYGAAAQVYKNYNTDKLVNSHLTAEQLAYGTPASEIPALTTHQSTGGQDKNNTDTAIWNSAGLVLGDSVTVKVTVTLPGDPSNYKVKLSAAGKSWESTEFKATATANKYDVFFNVLNPAQMREAAEFVVYDANGNAVSTVLTYSIETYAYNQCGKATTPESLKNLLYAMIKYGDSVAAYSNN